MLINSVQPKRKLVSIVHKIGGNVWKVRSPSGRQFPVTSSMHHAPGDTVTVLAGAVVALSNESIVKKVKKI